MGFNYRVVTVTCDECCEEEINIPVNPPGEGGKFVIVPHEYQGWKITTARQICPPCDAKLDGN